MSMPDSGVQLRTGASASRILHAILLEATTRFPAPFSPLSFPANPDQFKKFYVDIVPAFEAYRVAAAERTEIAVAMSRALENYLVFRTETAEHPLRDWLAEPANPRRLETAPAISSSGWRPEPDYQGRRWQSLRALGEQLRESHVINEAASQALSWVEANGYEQSLIRLNDRKVVVFGANAEMAPTELLLQTGASVLWLDMAPPPEALINSPNRSGELSWTSEGVNLLTQTREIIATIIAFAGSAPVDLCLYAYAPGQARELRLQAAMNGIVNALPDDVVGSINLLLSPTTATPLEASDIGQMEIRRRAGPTWERVLGAAGLLGRGGGCAVVANTGASRTVVGIQGASYQAAQYLGKLLVAESWSAVGKVNTAESKPLRVSANTAAITQTRSLDHPVFDAAFGGAAALQVETFTPEQSKCLNGLLMIHDWLNPRTPVPGELRIHGGIHTLPYPLNVALRTAAAIGFLRSPKLLSGLVFGTRTKPRRR